MNAKIYLIAIISLFVLSSIVFQNCKKDEDNQAPSCTITSPIEGEECVLDEMVPISVNATDSDGSITSVKFIIDKVEVASVGNSPYKFDWNTSGESIGNHTIKATSIDNEGASASDEVTIQIIEGQSADFSADPTTGDSPLTVTFTDQSTNNPTSWAWDFGDGNSSSEQNPSHTYENMGSYDVSLTTTNGSGTYTETKTNFIIAKGIFIDTRDNHEYRIVEIGDQVWFAENLNYETPNSWWYNNDETNGDKYGRLYTWEAARTACPMGTHLPTDDEWKILEMFLGMSQTEADGVDFRGTDEGKKIKSITGWISNLNGTDEFGFSALPAGERWHDGTYFYMGSYTSWWVVENCSETWSRIRYLDADSDQMGRRCYTNNVGYSIRCVKD